MNSFTSSSAIFIRRATIRLAATILLLHAGASYASDSTGGENNVVLQTSMGDIRLKLYYKRAPESVKNFLQYLESGYYDGTIFHRVIDGFMIQGGGFDLDMNKKPTHPPIRNEADNKMQNNYGSIAMARTNVPHSATSQFFINVANNGFLNHTSKSPKGWGYAVFGKVIDGMDVVNRIKKSAVARSGIHAHLPVTPVIITRAYIDNGVDDGQQKKSTAVDDALNAEIEKAESIDFDTSIDEGLEDDLPILKSGTTKPN